MILVVYYGSSDRYRKRRHKTPLCPVQGPVGDNENIPYRRR